MAADRSRTHEEVLRAFIDQREFIKDSAKNYDDGKTREARRIATAAYVLLHDGTGRTKSVLTQLGIKDKLKYANTGKPLNLFPRIALVTSKLDDTGASYVAHCQVPGFSIQMWPWFKQSDFKDWWDAPIFITEFGGTLTRKGLVFALRSQDGGAHFDERWGKGNYQQFATTNDTVVTTKKNQIAQPIPDAHLASMRQIGWEIEETLKHVTVS